MKRQLLKAALAHPLTISLAVTLVFSSRFLECMPFSGSVRGFNQETVATLTSFLMFAQEPWSFPIGTIQGLAFPFSDGNIGNVGAIPLFALIFKLLGTAFPYFQTFDYFVLIDIVSCFLTAYFAQKILVTVGVRQLGFRALGALLTGASFLVFTRSAWTQPFCIVAFPLFTAWLYAMLLTIQRGKWKPAQDVAILSIYPIAALIDNYSLFAILLGTSVLLVRELYEAIFGGSPASLNRSFRLMLLCIFGSALCVLALYVIGMFPLPPVPQKFSSYDFGMGGRYHVADLFSPWLPAANGVSAYFREPSLLGRLDFPVSTNLLADGQYEGVAYIGTSALLIWCLLAAIWLLSIRKDRYGIGTQIVSTKSKLILYSPWKKVGIASLCVFIFSLGYELHILGHAFPGFSGMPAAWIADRFPAVHNIRAQGRLASLLSLFLILEGVRQLSIWCEARPGQVQSNGSKRRDVVAISIISFLAVIHLIEIFPLLKPVPVQPTHRIGDWTKDEIAKIRLVSAGHDGILIAPSWREALNWEAKIYSLAYYSGLRSNIYLIARTLPEREDRISRDLDWVMKGQWDPLVEEYGEKVLFAIPMSSAETLRSRMSDRYEEFQIGTISLWSKRQRQN